jgi:hypothetical protein
MSLGGGGGKTTTTTTMDPTLKPYVTYALDEAKGIYNQPMPNQTDPSQLVAGQGQYTQEYKQGISGLNAGADTLQGAISGTQQAASSVSGAPQYQTTQFDPRTLNQETIAQYANPFQQQVIDAAMQGEALRSGQEMAQLRARQAGIKALGGSRGAVEEALLRDSQGRRAAEMEANLLAQGYDKATALAAAQQQAQFEADKASEASRQFAENAGIARGEFGLRSSQLMSDQAAQERNMEIQRLQGLKDIGVMDQALEQRLLDLQEAQKQYVDNYKKLQLSDMASIFYGAPAGSKTTQSGGGTSTGQSLLGAALYGIGALV